MDVHRPRRPLPRLRGSPLQIDASASFPLPWRKSPCLGGVHSVPPRGQTWITLGIVDGGGSPPIVPLSCPACVSAKSGPGGWSDSRPGLSSRPKVMLLLSPPKVKVSVMSGAITEGVGGVPVPPFPLHVGPYNGSPATLLPGPNLIPGIRRTATDRPSTMVPLLSSSACR